MSATGAAQTTPISGRPVEPLLPVEGPIWVVLVGEAPGPRGADRSGIPFWGDAAGRLVYRALERAGMAQIPAHAWEMWEGGRLRERGLRPILLGALLTNAFPACPIGKDGCFRAPSKRELHDPANRGRLETELALARARCPREPAVIALGMRAKEVLETLVPAERLEVLPHPSAQGLLQAAPGHGRGCKLKDLQEAWQSDLASRLTRRSSWT